MMDNQPDKELNVAYAVFNPMNWIKLIKAVFGLGKWFTSSNKNKAVEAKETFKNKDTTKSDMRDSRGLKSVEKNQKGMEMAKTDRRSLSSVTGQAIQASTARNAKIGRSMSVPNISLSK